MVTRLGGDVSAVLAVETDVSGTLPGRDRVQALLDQAAAPAGVGVSAREPAAEA